MKATLVIMAAGMGSRFKGGLKQIEPIGLHGEIIADYSVYDAKKAGFEKIVFVIRKQIEKDFNESIFNHISKEIEAEYVYQELDILPNGYMPLEGRVKPWGTGHAVLCCQNAVKENFAVINADDFYGADTFKQLYNHITNPSNSTGRHCMVGFKLKDTVSEHGSVSRGVCKVNSDGTLAEIIETLKIETRDGAIYSMDGGTAEILQPETTVSMSAWGFSPDIFQSLEKRFIKFLESNRGEISSEFLLPVQVEEVIKANEAKVDVLPGREKWYGVTNKEDAPIVRKAIGNMIKEGLYPEKLWR